MGSIIYNGHEIQDLIINGNQAQLWLNGQKLYPSAEPVDPYNPLGLGYGTIRLKFAQGYTPTAGNVSNVLVDEDENIWDCTSINPNTGLPTLPTVQNNTNLIACIGMNLRVSDTSYYNSLTTRFRGCTNLVSVDIGCTDHITNMSYTFAGCASLTSVPLLDTSSCTNMLSMFNGCTSLTSVPLLDTSSCTNMRTMFNGCTNVQSGALALYQQASTQATTVTNHTNTFTNCGRDTVTGAAELAQIPTSWGGTMA